MVNGEDFAKISHDPRRTQERGRKKVRGYFGIGVLNPKTEHNIGTLWRSAFNFGSLFMFTIGKRYKRQSSDTCETWRHLPLYHFLDMVDFQEHRPYDCLLIGVEQCEESINIKEYTHPERAIYLLGAEDNGLTKEAIEKCQRVIHIESPRCLNVAVAGSIVMFDRNNK